LLNEDLLDEDLGMVGNLIAAAPHQQAASVPRRKVSQVSSGLHRL
jgi:hypothetical protein